MSERLKAREDYPLIGYTLRARRRASQRSIVVTVYATFALALLAVYSPLVLVPIAAVALAPFVYLRVTWKRDRRRRFWE